MGKRNFTAGNYVRRKIMYVLLKSLIAVAQERNQLVDITPEFPDILLQSFLVPAVLSGTLHNWKSEVCCHLYEAG